MSPYFALAIIVLASSVSAQARAQETAKDVIAAHLRLQGYKCDDPKSATRDVKSSRRGEAVWKIICEDARYEVRMVPDMADVIAPF